MNIYVGTGWIPEDGSTYVGPTGEQIMYFELMVPGAGTAEPARLKMRLQGESFGRFGGLITRGRAVIVHAEPMNVPVERHGVIRGERTVFRVVHAEFPNRSRAVPEQGTEEAASAEQRPEAAA